MEHPAHRTDGLLVVSEVTAGKKLIVLPWKKGFASRLGYDVESENAAS